MLGEASKVVSLHGMNSDSIELISFEEIGVREVSLVGILDLFSVSHDKALMISLVIFSAQIAFAMIGGILVLSDSMKGMEQR